jgi:hypothetical protein
MDTGFLHQEDYKLPLQEDRPPSSFFLGETERTPKYREEPLLQNNGCFTGDAAEMT